MGKTKSFLIITLLLFSPVICHANLIDVTVSTDKDTYQLNEEVNITIAAYNTAPNPVILQVGYYPTTYIMDELYNWAEGRDAPQVILYVSIDPGETKTWDMTHGLFEMQDYPLETGIHSVIGKILAHGTIDYESDPVEFTVIPEPFTITFFVLGGLLIRKK